MEALKPALVYFDGYFFDVAGFFEDSDAFVDACVANVA
jgi:hypothetical protein